MIDFKAVASGSHGNCYIVDDGHTKLMLECGLSIKQLRKKGRFIAHEIQACLTSHEH